MSLTIATWNVNSLKVRLPHLEQWLAATPVDVVGLQEIKLADADFPEQEIAKFGLRGAWHGQRTYNGVALLARGEPPEDVVRGMPGYDDTQSRVIAGTVAHPQLGRVRVVDVYVPNGQSVGSDKYAYKLDWFGRLREYLAAELRRHEQVVVVGDWNVAPEDRDVHDPKAWEGQVLCSEPEREALRRVLGLGFVDVFRRFEQPEKSFSWWDYRMMAFRRNHGLRIDLVLASEPLAARCTACRIDREPRKWERPSDHTPVIATFEA